MNSINDFSITVKRDDTGGYQWLITKHDEPFARSISSSPTAFIALADAHRRLRPICREFADDSRKLISSSPEEVS